jgi:hypothetical protein
MLISPRENIAYAVGERVVQAVGIYGSDDSGVRIIEVELRIDWTLNAELTLSVPTITGGLSGWDGKQAPEVKVAGRRFANAVREMGLSTHIWVRFIPNVKNDPALHSYWKRELNLGGTIPRWRSSPRERSETFLDLNEVSVYIRRASD